MFTGGFEKTASIFGKAKHGTSVALGILKNKASAVGKHLHKYRRDYITGTSAAAGVSAAISANKMVKENK